MKGTCSGRMKESSKDNLAGHGLLYTGMVPIGTSVLAP